MKGKRIRKGGGTGVREGVGTEVKGKEEGKNERPKEEKTTKGRI